MTSSGLGPPFLIGLDAGAAAYFPLGMRAWIYIMASVARGTLYVGVTTALSQRVHQHREGLIPGFTRDYRVKMLVYYEPHDSIVAAIQREKNIKHWPRGGRSN